MEQDRGRKADLIKSLRSINEVVKEHPDMLNELIMMLEAKEEKSTGTQLDARRDDAYFETAHQGRKPPTEILQKAELTGGDSCDKDERNDKLIHAIEAKDSQIKEQTESLSEKEVRLIELQNRNQDATSRIHRMKEELGILSVKDDEIKQLKSRIAFLGEKRVKQDQSECEDTLSENRQSKLEEEFSSFVDGTRMDACDRFREIYKPKDQFTDVHCQRLACLIFEVSYERMNVAKEALVEFFKEVSKGLIQSAPNMSFEFTRNENFLAKGAHRYPKPNFYEVRFPVSLMRQNSNYPRDAVDALMLAVKETAHDCELDCFVEDVKAIIQQKWDSWRSKDKAVTINYYILYTFRYGQVLDDPKVVWYIRECIKIVWRMITQVPAMKIEYQSTQLRYFHTQKGCYRGMPSTGGDPKEEIAYYLWPALFDGGNRLVRKAEVLCKTA
ncbi:uncharacterized protein [Porites lutea]|uniref:uncharacterized protein isoform X2 n=1 Tax=Porites lutea TaxID=51062 RepID=UPI003CC519AF